MTRAGTYTRYSSDNQRAESIDAQLRAINKYCKDNDIMIVKNYIDEAITGTSDDRENFLKMIEDSKKGLFDVIIVHKLDRFARNRYDSAIYRKELKDAGVKLISVLERFDEDKPEDVLMLSLLEGLSEYYSKNLSREVKKGLTENALKGLHNGGTPPLGFDVNPDTKELVINEVEAEAVKLIFEMYCNGYGYDLIAKALNNKGYLTKVKKPFTKGSIGDILRNEKYIGHYVFNKRLSKKSGNRKFKDEKDIIKLENKYKPIVSLELWNKKEDIISSRLKPRKNATRQYLLTGKIFCNCCGGHFVGSSYTGGRNKIKYHAYESSNRKRKVKGCQMKRIRAEYIEKHVLDRIEREILNDDVMDSIATQVYNKYKTVTADDVKLLAKLEKKRDSIQLKIDNLLDLVLEKVISKSAMKSKNESLERELESVLVKINELTTTQSLAPTIEKIKLNLEYMKKNLESGDSDLKQLVIDTFVNEVIVHDEKIEVTLIVTPNLSSSYNLSSTKVTGDGAYITLYDTITREKLIESMRGYSYEELLSMF